MILALKIYEKVKEAPMHYCDNLYYQLNRDRDTIESITL